MTLRDSIILAFSFLVGLLSGVYFYFTSFSPIYVDHTYEPNYENLPTDYTVIGLRYGGFEPPSLIDPSFRVTGDGEYDYFPDAQKVEGTLPVQLQQAIAAALRDADLAAYSQPAPATKDCQVDKDGIDYEYNIELAGETYDLDTCFTDFSPDTELSAVLVEVWRYLESPDPDQFEFSVRNLPESDEPVTAEPTTGNTWRGLRGFFEQGFIDAGFETSFDEQERSQ